MSVEQIKTIIPEDTNLSDFSGIEKTEEGVDISERMQGILGKTQEHISQVSENNDNKLISMAQERLGIVIGENPDDKNKFLEILDSSLVV